MSGTMSGRCSGCPARLHGFHDSMLPSNIRLIDPTGEWLRPSRRKTRIPYSFEELRQSSGHKNGMPTIRQSGLLPAC
jgi:hypothetical protein